MCPLLSINKAYFEEKSMIYIKNQSKWNYLIKMKKNSHPKYQQAILSITFLLTHKPLGATEGLRKSLSGRVRLNLIWIWIWKSEKKAFDKMIFKRVDKFIGISSNKLRHNSVKLHNNKLQFLLKCAQHSIKKSLTPRWLS